MWSGQVTEVAITKSDARGFFLKDSTNDVVGGRNTSLQERFRDDARLAFSSVFLARGVTRDMDLRAREFYELRRNIYALLSLSGAVPVLLQRNYKQREGSRVVVSRNGSDPPQCWMGDHQPLQQFTYTRLLMKLTLVPRV